MEGSSPMFCQGITLTGMHAINYKYYLQCWKITLKKCLDFFLNSIQIFKWLLHYRFPSLFGEIENDIFNGGDLGIDSYGTSMPTLEEVFLRLGDDDDENKMEEEHEEKSNDDKKQATENGDIVGYEFESVSTKKNWWQTYSALLYVKHNHSGWKSLQKVPHCELSCKMRPLEWFSHTIWW